MSTFSLAIVIVAFIVRTYGHDCKEYSLTPSDQSLIDMMGYYLHTSRKADCPVTHSKQYIGVTYVRWGKKTCSKKSDIVYTGQAGGNQNNNRGGGSNYLCLPSDPENGKAYTHMLMMDYMVQSMRYGHTLNHPVYLLVWATKRFHVQYAGGKGKCPCQ
ncbi:uncharacterized protein LOC134721136 [Mytilus trossulus]|uniref:uncharacterized protein LOC134721136 n=1 Tax=Mytilus trossulus TaxID=6551 RepID=UPI0030065B2C